MISQRWLDLRRAAGIADHDGDIIAEWQAFEAEAIKWPNASQVAAMFGRSRETGRCWCARGLFGPLGAIKVDGVWRVNPDALETFTPPVEGAGGGRPKRKGAK